MNANERESGLGLGRPIMTFSEATTSTVRQDSNTSPLKTGTAIVLFLAGLKLLLHLLTAGRYGIFRDEMYYVACSEHLAWATSISRR